MLADVLRRMGVSGMKLDLIDTQAYASGSDVLDVTIPAVDLSRAFVAPLAGPIASWGSESTRAQLVEMFFLDATTVRFRRGIGNGSFRGTFAVLESSEFVQEVRGTIVDGTAHTDLPLSAAIDPARVIVFLTSSCQVDSTSAIDRRAANYYEFPDPQTLRVRRDLESSPDTDFTAYVVAL